MKTLEIYIITYGTIGADYECAYFFSISDAISAALDIEAHLTSRERRDHTVLAEGYTVRLPDDYTVSTARCLDRDLVNGDVESPDFDICTGQYTSKQILCHQIL